MLRDPRTGDAEHDRHFCPSSTRFSVQAGLESEGCLNGILARSTRPSPLRNPRKHGQMDLRAVPGGAKRLGMKLNLALRARLDYDNRPSREESSDFHEARGASAL